MSAFPRHIAALLTAVIALAPVASAVAGSFSLLGATIDRIAAGAGAESALFVVATGATTGSPTSFAVDAKLQDSADGSTWADVASTASPMNPAVAITQITAVSTVRRLAVDLSVLRRFVRLVHQVAFNGGSSPTVAVQSTCLLGGGAAIQA